MAPSASQLAKLTRPRLHAPLARDRLFRLIGELRLCPVVWIGGPPGAGKTTLAATYVGEAGGPSIWYQLDSGDSDPATFFYYLREAAAPFSPRRNPLPLLTPEYLQDLPGFARRVFRELIASIPRGAVLTFDNYQEIAPDSRLHEVFSAAIDEIPRTANLLLVSRTAPPPAFARAIVSEKIARLGWEELAFTREETRLLAISRAQVDGETVNYLFEQSQGWAAGVMLLLERMRREGTASGEKFSDTPEATFEYFAYQIFDPEPRDARELLMAISFLPRVTVALAEAISVDSNAASILNRLFRRRLFIDKHPGNPPVYQLHSLFRMFLQNRAIADLGVNRVRALRLAVAELLHKHDLTDDAVTLYAQAGEWSAIADLVVSAAPELIAHGRWRTLADWIAHLPPEIANAHPWIGYWLGYSKVLVDPPAAREGLERAFASFEAKADGIGQLLCAVAILQAVRYDYGNFSAMGPWATRVAGLIEKGVRPPHPEDELRANAAVLMAATFLAPRHPMLARCLQRVQALVLEPYDVNLRVWVAGLLYDYAAVAMDEEAVRVASKVGAALLGSQHLSPWIALAYLSSEAYMHSIYGIRTVRNGHQIVSASGRHRPSP